MPRNASEIDRLIEEGLMRYGTGDVDGALSMWEQVLATDPGHPQATSYVEYVRMNYEVLKTDPSDDAGTHVYGLSDEPEYQIEIVPGELVPGEAAPLYMDPLDEGWFLDAEETEASRRAVAHGDAGTLTLELDADEPALEIEAGEPPGPGFEDETSTYAKNKPAPDNDFGDSPTNDFAGRNNELTPGFGPEATPAGFKEQTTDIRKPNLGFVQPRTAAPPELKVTVRTPSAATTSQTLPKIAPVKQPPPPLIEDSLTLRQPLTPVSDLIDSLPSPRRAGPTTRDLPDARRPPAVTTQPGAADTIRPSGQTRPPAPPIGAADTIKPTGQTRPPSAKPSDSGEPTRARVPTPAGTAPITRPPPSKSRPPATAQLNPEDISRVPTRQGPPSSPPKNAETVAMGVAPTREFASTPTEKLPMKPLPASGMPSAASESATPTPADNGGEPFPSLNVPTRDLGLRTARAQSPPIDEEEPTKQSDVRQIRDAAARASGAVAAIDPLTARADQILAEVDAGASPDENKEDRTRRRISSLIDRAQAWNGIGEYDKAVAAVDLALLEDPNSALAQKLIHRNRDTIMTVFQNYVGDLQRTPALAKPLHELANAPISPRAAFLLSRVDGTLSIDELLDVSGMPRLEAYRYLCQLFLRGILR